jgi:phosphoribosylformylglycinamidine cyclo-ligase
MAHITGGGFPGNIPRILPESTAACIDTGTWDTPPLFRLIQQKGEVGREEMYRVFNMGIGMAVVASPENAASIKERLPEAIRIGEVVHRQDTDRIKLL